MMPIVLDELDAVVGGRLTNDGADPTLLGALDKLSTSVDTLSAGMLQSQQQQNVQLMQYFMQQSGGGAVPAASAPPT